MIKEGAATFASTHLWTKEQARTLNTHLVLFSEVTQSFHCWTPKNFDAKGFENALAHSGDTGCYFSVSLLRANIFFKAEFVACDKLGIQFRWPEAVYKVQRRTNMRFPIPDGHVLKAKFQDPLSVGGLMTRKVIDISAGGLGLLVDPEDEPVFHIGLELKQLTFTVAGRAIQATAIVRHKRELKDDPRLKGWKVGVEFMNLKPADGQFIAAWVFEESRKFFSRYI